MSHDELPPDAYPYKFGHPITSQMPTELAVPFAENGRQVGYWLLSSLRRGNTTPEEILTDLIRVMGSLSMIYRVISERPEKWEGFSQDAADADMESLELAVQACMQVTEHGAHQHAIRRRYEQLRDMALNAADDAELRTVVIDNSSLENTPGVRFEGAPGDDGPDPDEN